MKLFSNVITKWAWPYQASFYLLEPAVYKVVCCLCYKQNAFFFSNSCGLLGITELFTLCIRDHSSITSACFWLFQAHPSIYISIDSVVNQQTLPFSDPTNLFADIILERSLRSQYFLSQNLEPFASSNFLTPHLTQKKMTGKIPC